MAKQKPTRKEQIANKRQIAAELLAQRQKEDKQRKRAMWGTFGVIIVAIIAAVAYVIVSSIHNKLPVSETSPNSMSSNGIILTSKTEAVTGTGFNLESGKPVESKTLLPDSKVPHIEIYLDFDCPHCKEFEEANEEYLETLLENKKATVEYKPIVVIGSNHSRFGGNAAACVAENAPDRYLDLNKALFAEQGKQNKTPVSKIVEGLAIQGEAGKKVEECVTSKVYSNWLNKASDQALERTDADNKQMVEGTPTVIIDGVKYPFAPNQFRIFMETMINEGKTANEVIKTAEGSAQ